MTPSVFLTHNPEDLDAYYGRALPELQALDVDIVTNPTDGDLSTDELLTAAAGCQIVIAHRATPGDAAFFNAHADVIAF
ncbi:MAG: hydroxyacid dehydrogenase, partial [Acidimicrobiia bacterium]|nr:hydroxyacid dehydrogenase [Acidimicrobiia bacterium]